MKHDYPTTRQMRRQTANSLQLLAAGGIAFVLCAAASAVYLNLAG